MCIRDRPSVTPSISISRTPSISISRTPSVTPSTSVPGGPSAFTFSDTFSYNFLADCTGFGDLANVSMWEWEITTVNNCTNQTPTNATSTLNFTVTITCDSGNTDIYTSVTSGNNTTSGLYERSNGCTGNFCSAGMNDWPGTLSFC